MSHDLQAGLVAIPEHWGVLMWKTSLYVVYWRANGHLLILTGRNAHAHQCARRHTHAPHYLPSPEFTCKFANACVMFNSNPLNPPTHCPPPIPPYPNPPHYPLQHDLPLVSGRISVIPLKWRQSCNFPSLYDRRSLWGGPRSDTHGEKKVRGYIFTITACTKAKRKHFYWNCVIYGHEEIHHRIQIMAD